MAWSNALLNSLAGLLHCLRPFNHSRDTGKQACVTEQKPSPLHSKRINLTQESLVDQAPDKRSSNNISASKAVSLERTCTQCPAPTSLLLTLPFELRTNIYALALGGNFLTIRRKDRKIGHIRQYEPCHTSDLPHRFHSIYEGQYLQHPNQFSTTGLPLLLTCRSIYREAIHLLYTSNTFFISDISILVHWADLSLLPPQRLAAIRHLSVHWVRYSDPGHFCGFTDAPYDWRTWSRFWEIVATCMPGLKKLDLWMEYIGRREENLVEHEWVKAMMGVKRIHMARVEIVLRRSPWAGDRCEEVERVVKEAWSQE